MNFPDRLTAFARGACGAASRDQEVSPASGPNAGDTRSERPIPSDHASRLHPLQRRRVGDSAIAGNSIVRARTAIPLANSKASAKVDMADHKPLIKTLEPGSIKCPKNGTRVISVGGGPRGESQAMAEMELLRLHRADFDRIQKLGGTYNIETVIIERKGEDDIGRGNAWGQEHGAGTANTGAEASKWTANTRGQGGLLNYSARFADYMGDNHKRLVEESKGHPVVSTLLNRALDGTYGPKGVLVTDFAVMTRAQQGMEELQRFRQALSETTEAFPFYHLHVMTSTSVEKIDISSPHRPMLSLADAHTEQTKGVLVGNTVRLNTGTTLSSPISDAAVSAHSFIQAMNPAALKVFLASKNLLDEAGQVKSETKLALGGSGLSAYDQLLALVPMMSLFVSDDTAPLGYKVSEDAKAKYRGAITFISNTPGKWIPPRHANDPAWRQDGKPLSNAKEQHALRLHNQGEEEFRSWGVLADASVAATLGMVPKDVRQEGLSTEELLRAQYASSVQSAQKLEQARHLAGKARAQAIDESTRTLEGARRQASLSTVLGFGMEPRLEEAFDEMARMAPLTFDNQKGYLIHRAQVKSMTEPGTEIARDNAELLKRFNSVMTDVTSSPMVVHATVPMLFEAGIATYMSGSYEGFKADGVEHSLSFMGHDGAKASFDAFIVSPTFNRGAERAIASLTGQVKAADPRIPDIGEVTMNRRILAKNGQPTQLEDYSLNGKGAPVPGSRSKSYAFSTDVNNRESATDVAPGLAYRRMAQEHLAAAGFKDPVGKAENLYQKYFPGDEAYATEVARFAPHFDAAIIKAEFLKAAELAAHDDAQAFKALADAARSASTVKTRAALFELPFREAVRTKLNTLPVDRSSRSQSDKPDLTCEQQMVVDRHRDASRNYADALAGKPAFMPASNSAYHRRFVDVPLEIHRQVYKDAFELAESRLQRRRVPKCPSNPCTIL